jgi:SAM-dependent methyltransferase
VARALFGHDPVVAVQPASLRPFHGFASNPFDLATCMFAVHYFFDAAASLAQFAANVAGALRPGGHFVGCCLDGGLVDKLLAAEAPDVGDSVEAGGTDGRPAWRITRQYKGATTTKKGGFGRRIDVYMESIGQELPEFLVDYEDLVAAMATAGLRPVDAAEAAELGLVGGAATGTFGATFDDMKAKAGPRASQQQGPVAAALAMSDGEKRYSFMNRWFVFRKGGVPLG